MQSAQKNTPATARSLAKQLGGYIEIGNLGSGKIDVVLVTAEDGTIWSDGSGAHTLTLADNLDSQTRAEVWSDACEQLRMLLKAGVRPEPGYADGE